jgi:hypothetical protein
MNRSRKEQQHERSILYGLFVAPAGVAAGPDAVHNI